MKPKRRVVRSRRGGVGRCWYHSNFRLIKPPFSLIDRLFGFRAKSLVPRIDGIPVIISIPVGRFANPGDFQDISSLSILQTKICPARIGSKRFWTAASEGKQFPYPNGMSVPYKQGFRSGERGYEGKTNG